MSVPDTQLFMNLGYGFILGVMGLYVLRLWWVARRLHQQELELRQLLEEKDLSV